MSSKTALPPLFRWTRLNPSSSSSSGGSTGQPCARSSHGLSLVNNRLILYGGEHVARTPLDAAQATWGLDLTNPSSPVWYPIPGGSGNEDAAPSPRVAHAQDVVDHCVYIFGGRNGIAMDERPLNDMWRLDCSGPPGSETWAPVPIANPDETPEPRSFHRLQAIDSTLYIFGGCGANGRMADLHSFDTTTNAFHNWGTSPLLRGRGGPNLFPLAQGQKLAVVAGFAGEETADGHIFNVSTGQWDATLLTADDHFHGGLRPRSVCAAASFPSVGVSIIFGGEVNPSDRGHEGAGGFANDLVVLDASDASLLTAVPAPGTVDDEDPATTTTPWPQVRGWSAAASIDHQDGTGQLYVFGGLCGDDQNPVRLDDLWRLDITKAT